MKSYLLFFMIVFSFSRVSGEELANGMLFPRFEEGTVIYKDGRTVKASLNYNTVEEEMLFKNPDGSILALDDPGKVSAISIGNRFFEYASRDAFYERIPVDSVFLYVQWKSTLISEGKGSGYGGRSQAAAVTNIGTLSNQTGNYTRFNLDEEFKVKSECSYYLKLKNKWKRFNSAKTLGKLFKGHGEEIERFASEENIDFKNPEDVKRIIAFCSPFIN